MEDLLNEMSIALGTPVFLILAILATSSFLSFGIFLCLITGSRKMFIFGIIPIIFGVWIAIFPFYFTIIGVIVALCISFITFPKSISYKDRIDMIEAEIYMEYLHHKG